VDEPTDKLINPHKLAVLYYFGDLQYWKLPQIAADALEQGYDGTSLRRLAGLMNPVASDIRAEDIDSAFTEMGVAAPLTEDYARLVLAAESATKALRGDMNVFDAATHIRIHLCRFEDPPAELHRIVSLSEQSKRGTARWKWKELEAELKDALRDFLDSRE
jgi:hypothetical protein